MQRNERIGWRTGELLAFFLFSSLLVPCSSNISAADFSASGDLSPVETSVLSLVNGTEAYSFDLHLESIALSHFAFRAAGSPGANEAAEWVADKFDSFGLETEKEEFLFKTWNLKSKPLLTIDEDGDNDTTDDQARIDDFQCAHYSLPTSSGGVFADLVVLPLPDAADIGEIGSRPIDYAAWNAIDTAGKVVLVGVEVRQDPTRQWENSFRNKLSTQTPVAVIFTLWYDWMQFVPDYFPSAGGCPFSYFGKYLWNLDIPTGFVNHQSGLWIRNMEDSEDVSAKVTIDTVVDNGPHYNVVGKLTGYVEPSKLVIVSGHYDTVMCAGFCDNGAGASGVVELAKAFTEAEKRGLYSPRYSILFVALASEEVGLVGAAEFVKRHKSQMASVVAVLNMDCIGNDYLHVTATDPTNEFDLDQIIMEAAWDLGVTATLDLNVGGSDHEVFLQPSARNSIHYGIWGVDLGISDAMPVKASSMLISYPLSYRDLWNMGSPGWIHTTYDNSTSTQTMNWVEADDLEIHLKVAALTIVRVSPPISKTDLNEDGTVNILDLTIAALAYGTKQGDPKWNAVADLDKSGVVNILDIAIIARDFGKTP